MEKPPGRRRSRARLNSAGTSLRLARSPEAPKMTTVQGSGVRSTWASARRGLRSFAMDVLLHARRGSRAVRSCPAAAVVRAQAGLLDEVLPFRVDESGFRFVNALVGV